MCALPYGSLPQKMTRPSKSPKNKLYRSESNFVTWFDFFRTHFLSIFLSLSHQQFQVKRTRLWVGFFFVSNLTVNSFDVHIKYNSQSLEKYAQFRTLNTLNRRPASNLIVCRLLKCCTIIIFSTEIMILNPESINRIECLRISLVVAATRNKQLNGRRRQMQSFSFGFVSSPTRRARTNTKQRKQRKMCAIYRKLNYNKN